MHLFALLAENCCRKHLLIFALQSSFWNTTLRSLPRRQVFKATAIAADTIQKNKFNSLRNALIGAPDLQSIAFQLHLVSQRLGDYDGDEVAPDDPSSDMQMRSMMIMDLDDQDEVLGPYPLASTEIYLEVRCCRLIFPRTSSPATGRSCL